jgi:regulator of RNase E activity RraA
MSVTETDRDPARIAEIATRLKRLYSACVYDVMDEMGLPNQCLDLGIKSYDITAQIAGPAYTVAAGPDMRPPDETPPNPKLDRFGVFNGIYDGCAVVVAAAGERQSGIWGELMSTASRVKGARGIVIDGGIRDGRLLQQMEVPIAMTGTLTSQVRVDPGDWIFGDMDGVLVIPKEALEEVLAKSEEAKDIEDKVREEVQRGVPVADVFDKYGRL